MKKIILVLCLIAGILPAAKAQKEVSNWVFGHRAGLTWNTLRTSFPVTAVAGGATETSLPGLPSPLTTSIDTREGCFSLSDPNTGQLLFYSDGMTVWNRNGVAMSNGSGLSGHNSSTQSGIIFPYPNASNKYVAVTIGAVESGGASRIYYSVIDMNLNSGLGDVVAGQKNIPFLNVGGTPTTGLFYEQTTSIKIPNSADYWVVSPTMTGNNLYAWRFTSAGITSDPVTSPISPAVTHNWGYIKFTPDGKHFIWMATNTMVYGDFDITTGKFTNIKTAPSVNCYGVEFSPDQKLVYIDNNPSNNGTLTVYKADELFSMPSIATVSNKTYTIGTFYSGIQLGPDKRIYLNGFDVVSYMIVIDDPNNFDNPKIYKTNSGFLSGSTGLGIPSFAANWFNIEAPDKDFVCAGHSADYTVTITVSGGNQPIGLFWKFGDGTTVNQPIVVGQTIYTKAHTYNQAKPGGGKYTITVTPYKAANDSLSSVTLTSNVIECVIKTNRMIRTDMKNGITPY